MNLSPGLSRLVAIFLLVLVFGGIYRLVVVPTWTTLAEQREGIADREEQIRRLSAIAARSDSVKQSLDRVQARPELNDVMLDGTSPTLAAAALQERVKGIVEKHGGRLTSTQVLTPISQGSFQMVGINVRISADSATTQNVLYALEENMPILVLDDVTVVARRARTQSRNRRRNQRRNSVRQNQSKLDVRFKVSGFMTLALDAGKDGNS